ncbi:MAG: fibronectin type III domain-containing protein, partial [Salinispira sp.]
MNVKLYTGARFLFCAMLIVLIAACPMPEPVAEPTVPGTMAAPTLEVGNEQLIAAWTAPNNGGSPITAYELQYRTGDEAWTEITSGIGTNTDHSITGLTKAAEYDVQVRAVNAIGAGDWSESATVPDAPDAPTLYAGTGRLVALWTAPEDDGGSPITGYELQYRTGGGAWTEIAPAPGTQDHTIDGLTNDDPYEVQARAVNEVGDGGWSETAMKTPTDSAIMA